MAKIKIKYVGKKEVETDPYLRLEWHAGTEHDVEEEQAAWLLHHTDSFADARTDAQRKKHPIKGKEKPRFYAKKTPESSEEQAPLANLQIMDGPALQGYALRNFNERLPDTMQPPEMRTSIMHLMSRSLY